MNGLIFKLSDWYFSKQALPYWCVLALDSIVVAFAYYVGSYIELGGFGFAQTFWEMSTGALICILLFLVPFRLFHTYSGIIRYSSFIDLQRVVLATSTGTILVALASCLFPSVGAIMMPGFWGICIIFLVSTLLMWLERIVVKLLFDNFRADDATPVAIYGTKAGGVSLANSITSIKNKEYRLVAFISDTNEMKNATLMGKRIYTNGEGIANTMKR